MAVVAGRAGAVPMEVDGDTLAFDSDRSNNGDIYLVRRLGGPALLDATPWSSVEARPSWEPTRTAAGCPGVDPPEGDPQRIAFQSDHGTAGDQDIQTVYPDLPNNPGQSREAVDVTADPASDDTAPAWSPSEFLGQADIAYERAPAGQAGAKRDIWVIDPATGDRVDLTNDPADDEANPEWSPIFDRLFLAYDSDRGGTRQVWIQEYTVAVGANLPAPKGDPIQVTHGPAPAADPTWVAYTPFTPDDPVQLTHDLIFRTDELGTSFLDDLRHDFATFDPLDPPLPYDGTDGTVFPVTGDPGGDGSPAWSSLGDMLAYDGTRNDPAGTDHDILAMSGRSLDDSDPGLPLTPSPSAYAPSPAQDRHPAWQPHVNCAEAIPHLPTPAPVTRTPHTGGGGGGSGGGNPSSGDGVVSHDPGGPGDTTGQGPKTVRLAIRGVSARSTGHGANRRVRITLTLSRPAQARVKLLRGRRTVSNGVFALHAGRNALAVRVPRAASAGTYRLTIKAVGGNTVRLSRSVRLPG